MAIDLPADMQFIEQTGDGPPEVLQPALGPLPSPGAGEVLLRVAAAGVNRPDCLQRAGGYPPPPGASPIVGLEVAGEIVGVGEDVSGEAVGRKVTALLTGGGYAEYCVPAYDLCLPIPAGMSLLEAAALPETYFTVWTNVFQRGRLAEGETFLVHGGSSGIGVTAIQLAKAFGAKVLATAGSTAKCAFCMDHGADRAINYREEDFVEIAKAETEGRGVDLVLDMVGAPYLAKNIEALAVEGRLVQIAFLHGSKTEFNMAPMMLKRLTLTGSTLRPRTVAQKKIIADELEARVWPLLSAGQCRPVIHQTFPLVEAAKAHALMESSAHMGKIMLEVAH